MAQRAKVSSGECKSLVSVRSLSSSLKSATAAAMQEHPLAAAGSVCVSLVASILKAQRCQQRRQQSKLHSHVMQLSATDLAKWQVKLQKQGGGLKKAFQCMCKTHQKAWDALAAKAQQYQQCHQAFQKLYQRALGSQRHLQQMGISMDSERGRAILDALQGVTADATACQQELRAVEESQRDLKQQQAVELEALMAQYREHNQERQAFQDQLHKNASPLRSC